MLVTVWPFWVPKSSIPEQKRRAPYSKRIHQDLNSDAKLVFLNFEIKKGWADESIDYLNEKIAAEGPFYGLLGYSQGSAFIPVFLSNTSNRFNRLMMYNGYLPTTHEGLECQNEFNALFLGVNFDFGVILG